MLTEKENEEREGLTKMRRWGRTKKENKKDWKNRKGKKGEGKSCMGGVREIGLCMSHEVT